MCPSGQRSYCQFSHENCRRCRLLRARKASSCFPRAEKKPPERWPQKNPRSILRNDWCVDVGHQRPTADPPTGLEMWSVINKSRFKAGRAFARDVQGAELWIVAVRATFTI